MNKPKYGKPRGFKAVSLSRRLPKPALPKSAPPRIANPAHPNVHSPASRKK